MRSQKEKELWSNPKRAFSVPNKENKNHFYRTPIPRPRGQLLQTNHPKESRAMDVPTVSVEGGLNEGPCLEQKKIILVRHSESINNVAKRDAYEAWSNVTALKSLPSWSQLSSTASLLAVPMNTDLSEDGLRMVSSLRRVMDESNFVSTHGVELVVHSHLTRAARTCSVLFNDTGMFLEFSQSACLFLIILLVHLLWQVFPSWNIKAYSRRISQSISNWRI